MEGLVLDAAVRDWVSCSQCNSSSYEFISCIAVGISAGILQVLFSA
jgi:hypothetical protein